MENQSGWPYEKYPDFGWLFKTTDKCVPIYQSLMEKGYCIIKVPMWQVDQLRWTLTHCKSSDIVPNTKKHFEHPPENLGIFDNTSSASKGNSNRWSLRFKGGQHGDGHDPEKYPMTSLVKSWGHHFVLSPVIETKDNDFIINLPQIIGYTGRGDELDRDTQDQLPHWDDALYNFSLIVNYSEQDAVLRVAEGSH